MVLIDEELTGVEALGAIPPLVKRGTSEEEKPEKFESEVLVVTTGFSGLKEGPTSPDPTWASISSLMFRFSSAE